MNHHLFLLPICRDDQQQSARNIQNGKASIEFNLADIFFLERASGMVFIKQEKIVYSKFQINALVIHLLPKHNGPRAASEFDLHTTIYKKKFNIYDTKLDTL